MVTGLDQIETSLSVLAGDANSQLDYLREIGHIKGSDNPSDLMNVDEIALQFEDARYLVGGLLRSGDVSAQFSDCIEKIGAEFERYSGSDAAGFWTIRAIREDVRWVHIRHLARESLSNLAR